MAEFSGSFTTGASTGDQQLSGYTQAHKSTENKILAACNGFEGIAPGYLNSCAVTVTGANTVAINAGGALVDGKWYNNSASVSVNIPSAVGGGNTRIDRIVLRCSWAGFAVRITRIAGTDAASPTAPAITQTSGTTYDIMLCRALVNTSGTVTLTDERLFASGGTNAIADLAVTAAKIAGVVASRQGGSATDWNSSGTTNYAFPAAIIQVGNKAADASGNVVVTFPVAFSGKPIVICTEDSASVGVGRTANVVEVTTTGFIAFLVSHGTSHVAGTILNSTNWIAIGPA